MSGSGKNLKIARNVANHEIRARRECVGRQKTKKKSWRKARTRGHSSGARTHTRRTRPFYEFFFFSSKRAHRLSWCLRLVGGERIRRTKTLMVVAKSRRSAEKFRNTDVVFFYLRVYSSRWHCVRVFGRWKFFRSIPRRWYTAESPGHTGKW